MTFRRRFFTLFELMISLSILSLVFVIVGMNIQKALKEQRFLGDVQQVVSQLQLAQDLMLILKTDSTLVITKNDSGIHSHFQVEKIISKQWLANLQRPRKPLKSIKEISFDDRFLSESTPIKLSFLSGGGSMPRGELVIIGVDDSYKRKICLQGYPRPINSTLESEVLEELAKRTDGMKLYPKEVLEEIKGKA